MLLTSLLRLYRGREKMVESEGSSNEITVANEYLNCDFSDVVFSWSLEDIFNENLFKHKVQKIPETFQSVGQYFGSFVYPLLEETRTQLCSSFDTIEEAPYAQIVGLEESKSKPYRYGTGLYNVKVDERRNRFSSRKYPYTTLPGDVSILADAKQDSASDLQRMGRMWTFLLVTKIQDKDEIGYRHFDFKVEASKGNQVDADMKKSLFVFFLVNINLSKRIWNSLYKRGNLKIINEVLCTNSVVEENCQLCVQKEGIWYENFCPNLSSTLNNSQVEAVMTCLARINCNHKSSVDLIWGPPGTGKTKTVSMLLFTRFNMKCKLLFVLQQMLQLRKWPLVF
ncbi:hypothetical protein EZV62_018024 [Acer yangbiense]|uniref:DNA2/NAM7 helicase helicase domain-containing protein n=1 Tax=Acer yangbiense TaxID=1000413 RepID=A0A5C7HI90_9ROSI|nr:hypothetical protein EZV62_018024 [Acer yangbiense]